jgi:hypothetical protein
MISARKSTTFFLKAKFNANKNACSPDINIHNRLDNLIHPLLSRGKLFEYICTSAKN